MFLYSCKSTHIEDLLRFYPPQGFGHNDRGHVVSPTIVQHDLLLTYNTSGELTLIMKILCAKFYRFVFDLFYPAFIISQHCCGIL